MPTSQPSGLVTAFLLALILAPSWTLASAPAGDFLSPVQAFDFNVDQRSNQTVELSWDIAPGYYLYPDKFNIEIGGQGPAGQSVDWPDPATARDPFDSAIPAYKHHLSVVVPIGQSESLSVTWQGCAQAGLCYAVQQRRVDVSGAKPVVSIPDASKSASPHAPDRSTPLARDRALAAKLSGVNTPWTLAVFFGLGVLLAFTPCVLPMLPILSSIVVGAGAMPARSLGLSLCFVLTMALTYAALGIGAALSGLNLLAPTQTPIALLIMAAVFGLLALSMFGVFELRLPARLHDALDRAHRRQRSGHVSGAVAMGALSALLVSPCMTAPLAGALIYISQNGNVAVGGAALLCLGLGMGMPLVVIATVGARFLPRPGPWMNAVKRVFGAILLATAAYLLTGVFTIADVAAMIALALLVFVAIRYGDLKPRPVQIVFVMAGLALASLLIYPAMPGPASDDFKVAATDHGPIVVDTLTELDRQLKLSDVRNRMTLVTYSAQWCAACQHNFRVLSRSRVQQALSNWRWVEVDLTRDDADSRRLSRRYHILGPPTTLMFGPNGRERRVSRVVGEFSESEVLAMLARSSAAMDPARLMPDL